MRSICVVRKISVALVLLGGLSPLFVSPVFGSGTLPADRSVSVPLEVDSLITEAIEAGVTPGAVVAVVRDKRLAVVKAYGKRGQAPFDEPMTTDTVFDLASCSKVVATATAVMLLVEDGKLSADDPVDRYLPGFAPAQGEMPCLKHLLTHTSGLPSYADVDLLVKNYGAGNKAGLLAYICTAPRDFAPGMAYRYSCLNFIALQHIIEKVSGENLRDFTRRRIFDKLGMTRTDYCPTVTPVAPTEVQPDGNALCGVVHDPLARVMNNGVSGNVGLFSCAGDLAVFCSMLLNGGEGNGQRILQPSTVKNLLTVPAFAAPFGRTLGWVSCAPDRDTFAGTNTTATACGHTGYTGTCLVVDPARQAAFVFLTNYVHPHDRHNRSAIQKLRKGVGEALFGTWLDAPAKGGAQ